MSNLLLPLLKQKRSNRKSKRTKDQNNVTSRLPTDFELGIGEVVGLKSFKLGNTKVLCIHCHNVYYLDNDLPINVSAVCPYCGVSHYEEFETATRTKGGVYVK